MPQMRIHTLCMYHTHTHRGMHAPHTHTCTTCIRTTHACTPPPPPPTHTDWDTMNLYLFTAALVGVVLHLITSACDFFYFFFYFFYFFYCQWRIKLVTQQKVREVPMSKSPLVVVVVISWCFEPSHPQRITSGLNTNFTLSTSHSFHKSPYHK